MHHALLFILLPSTARQRRESAQFRVFVEGENTTQRLSFSFPKLSYSLQNSLVVVAFAPYFLSGRGNKEKNDVTSFKNFDWSVIFPNIALAKINIYEHRTKKTNESYTFQPLITSLSSFWLHPIFCGSSYCLNFDKFLDKPPLSLFASEAGLTFLIRYKTWALLPCLQSCRRPSRYLSAMLLLAYSFHVFPGYQS